MRLYLLQNATIANGLLGQSIPLANDMNQIKYFTNPRISSEVKIRAIGPNSSSAWQRTIILVSSDGIMLDYVAKVILTNVNYQTNPQIIIDPSQQWAALSPGNGTFTIGGQSVTISGDTEVNITGATNGITGVCVSVEGV